MTSLESQELYSVKLLIMFLPCEVVEDNLSVAEESVLFSLVILDKDMLLLVVLAFSLSGHSKMFFDLSRAASGARLGKGEDETTPRATEKINFTITLAPAATLTHLIAQLARLSHRQVHSEHPPTLLG